jgi:hypothetical protein
MSESGEQISIHELTHPTSCATVSPGESDVSDELKGGMIGAGISFSEQSKREI